MFILTVSLRRQTIADVPPAALKCSYSYHNHPPAETHCSFSGQDIVYFVSEAEAYSKAYDDIYEYVMGRTSETIDSEYDVVYTEFDEIYKKEIYQMSIDGLIDIDSNGYHETVKIISRKYGFNYVRRIKGNGK